MHAREEDRGKGEGGIFTSEGWNRRERTKGLRKKLAGQAEGLGNVNGSEKGPHLEHIARVFKNPVGPEEARKGHGAKIHAFRATVCRRDVEQLGVHLEEQACMYACTPSKACKNTCIFTFQCSEEYAVASPTVSIYNPECKAPRGSPAQGGCRPPRCGSGP